MDDLDCVGERGDPAKIEARSSITREVRTTVAI